MKEHHLKGVHGSVSAPLLKVLELCALYLVALDEEFTHQEQTWIDFQFGRGAADRFIDQMPTTDWDSCLPNIYDLASQLDWQDARSLRFNSEGFFKALLQCDGMNKTEKERLDGLLQWIFEALPQDKAYDIITKMKK